MVLSVHVYGPNKTALYPAEELHLCSFMTYHYTHHIGEQANGRTTVFGMYCFYCAPINHQAQWLIVTNHLSQLSLCLTL